MLCLAVGPFFGAVAARADASLTRAMALVDEKDWRGALSATENRLERDIVLWHALRAGQGDAETVRAFLARNGDWPGLPYLRQNSEKQMVAASAGAIRAYYAEQLPRTGTGALSYARALSQGGDRRAAEAEAIRAWTTLKLTEEERSAFLQTWRRALAPHHETRLDLALWRGWSADARAILPLVGSDWQALAQARLALRADRKGVDALIAAVPRSLASDPGLAYERFRWRKAKGRAADARALMVERSTSAAALGRPEVWSRDRRVYARALMRDGKVTEAYRLASRHYLADGSDYADLEWLSGYIAMRFLGRSDLALRHFRNFRRAVDTPISLARAGYWQGRAHEALGNRAEAREAYAFGAQYQTAFYGLLSAERAGLPFDTDLRGQARVPDWRGAPFTKSRVYDAALLLLASGEAALGERFLTHLAESLDGAEIAQMGAMLDQMGQPHIQVMLGKRAAQYGMQIPAPYFALHPIVLETRYPVPKELILAIARRESEFDPGVISPVGARGFMQLMPRTAQAMARSTGEGYSASRLLSDPKYNARLGAAYLEDLTQHFNGNLILMAAAYNAGPSRPERWMTRFGDPRSGRVDVVDWIEFIPFDETRNYVMRVAESVIVYRARLGLEPHPVPFSQELGGATLR